MITAFRLKTLAIINVKGVEYRVFMFCMTKNDVLNFLNDFEFGANKTIVDEIKEGAFGVTYFRGIHSGVNGKWYRKSWQEFDELGDIDEKYYRSNYYDVMVNKNVKCGTLLRFSDINRWISSIHPYGWFQWYFRYL